MSYSPDEVRSLAREVASTSQSPLKQLFNLHEYMNEIEKRSLFGRRVERVPQRSHTVVLEGWELWTQMVDQETVDSGGPPFREETGSYALWLTIDGELKFVRRDEEIGRAATSPQREVTVKVEDATDEHLRYPDATWRRSDEIIRGRVEDELMPGIPGSNIRAHMWGHHFDEDQAPALFTGVMTALQRLQA